MDRDIKRRIDTARDILVSKVPDPKTQVEQITTALVYKFMEDIDKESQNLGGEASFFANGYQQYAWSKLLDPKLDKYDRLNLYTQALVNLPQNPNLSQLFRDTFKDASLPYRDPDTLYLFLREINGFTYDYSGTLGEVYEYLLSILGSQSDAGQFRTPRHIVDFIVNVVDPTKEDTILDPACGTAGFLISAYKHILRQNGVRRPGDQLTLEDKLHLMHHLVGYDISPDMVRLSLMNMYFHGFSNPNIYEYDTLTSEERWNEKYDVIMANPPFMSPHGGTLPHKRFSILANKSEILFVDYIAEHLTSRGRAGVIVPEGIIFQSGTAYKALRKMLVEKYLWAVVSLPAGVFQPYSGVKTSILLMDKSLAKKAANILFLTVEDDGFDLGVRRRPIDKNDLPKALDILQRFKQAIQENKDVRETVGGREEAQIATIVEKSKIARNGIYRLSAERYDFTSLDSNIFKEIRLADLVKLRSGERFSQEDFQEDGVPFVQVRNVTVQGTLDLRKVQTIIPEVAKRSRGFSKIGDILITTAGSIGKVTLIDSSFPNGVCIDSSLRRLEILNIEQVLPEYLTIYLQSPIAQQQMKLLTTGSVIAGLSNPNLSELIVYLPDLTKQREIIALFKDPTLTYEDKFKIAFYNEKQVSIAASSTVKPAPAETKLDIGTLRQIVQTQFPFPIARAYTLFKSSEFQSGNVRVKALIDLSEAIVYYVYNVLVADQLRRLKIEDVELNELIKKSFISYSITDRLEVISHILKLARKNSNIDLFVPELTSVNLGTCTAIQNNIRNAWSHNSSFPENKCKQIISEYEPKLERLLQSLLFLKEYSLVQVQHITIHNNRLAHHVISMMGNNSLFQPGIEELEIENALIADSLHIILLAKARGYDFLDLYPFYLVHAWTQTGEHDHLCFLKQIIGKPPNIQLKVESTLGVGDTKTEAEMSFLNFMSDIPIA